MWHRFFNYLHEAPRMSILICEGQVVRSLRIFRWAPWALATMVLMAGCSGVLMESKGSDGHVDRLKLDAGESWSHYDTRPRNPSAPSGRNGLDDMSIMLKSVTTF
jgi:hypothetical protein